ncbi:hypothetical protein [Desulfosarcina sp.]|uniref:hypothetical protein n=1 Tax=Desulfosarcina sp. TaxID=2027861 RepID=UPI0035648513
MRPDRLINGEAMVGWRIPTNGICGKMAAANHRMPDSGLQVAQSTEVAFDPRQGA